MAKRLKPLSGLDAGFLYLENAGTPMHVGSVMLIEIPKTRSRKKYDFQAELLAHLQDHYTLYGEQVGLRSARKHIGWYVKTLPGGEAFRAHMNALEDCRLQHDAVADFFDELNLHMDRLPTPTVTDVTHNKQNQPETLT